MANINSKARKQRRRHLLPEPMPKSVVDEVRAIRNDFEEKLPNRGVDRSWSTTEHATACAVCGKLGEHACLPVLHEALEISEDMAENCWKIFRALEDQGVFSSEEPTSSAEVNLGVW